MLSAIPFRSGSILYIVLFGSTLRAIQHELLELQLPPKILFLHITDKTLEELTTLMPNNIAHIAFGSEGDGFVEAGPCGPRIKYLRNTTNYLLLVRDGVIQYMPLQGEDQAGFWINLKDTLERLILYVQDSRLARRSLQARDDLDFNPEYYLKSDRQTFAELILLLQIASAEQKHDTRPSDETIPITCFLDKRDFVPWLFGWIWPDSGLPEQIYRGPALQKCS